METGIYIGRVDCVFWHGLYLFNGKGEVVIISHENDCREPILTQTRWLWEKQGSSNGMPSWRI